MNQLGRVNGSGPIFVVGSMRSGSTLLRLILDSHENIAIGSESGFMGAASAMKSIPAWQHGSDWYKRLGWSEDEFDERISEFFAGIFQRYAVEHGKQRWGDKTPFHTMHIPLMARLFPTAAFVGVVRHPGAVVTSLSQQWGYPFEEAINYWVFMNSALTLSGRDLGGRFVLCRYEDLILDTESTLRDLMSFLREPWSENLLQHYEVHKRRGTERVVEGRTRTRDPIDEARVDMWKQTLSKEKLERIVDRCDALLHLLGYRPEAAAHRLAWRRDGEEEGLGSTSGDLQMLLDGRCLHTRMQEWHIPPPSAPPGQAELVALGPEELARRLIRTEGALTRMNARLVIRLVDALRHTRRVRSLGELKSVLNELRR